MSKNTSVNAAQSWPNWVNEGLIRNTQEVWSKVYKREVSEIEALEILMNLRNFVRVAVEVIKERESSYERGNLGAGIVERAEGGLFHRCPIESQSGKGSEERLDRNKRVCRRRIRQARGRPASIQRDACLGESQCPPCEYQGDSKP